MRGLLLIGRVLCGVVGWRSCAATLAPMLGGAVFRGVRHLFVPVSMTPQGGGGLVTLDAFSIPSSTRWPNDPRLLRGGLVILEPLTVPQSGRLADLVQGGVAVLASFIFVVVA